MLITIEQSADGPWRVDYEFARAVAEIDLGEDNEGFRARNWRAQSGGAKLAQRDAHDFLTPADGEKSFREASFLVSPQPIDLRKDYEPFIPMGDGGVLFYTGHFIPLKPDGERMNARLTVIAAKGEKVSTFGDAGAKIENWESPYKHPAFIYVGPSEPVQTEAMLTVSDATAPEWIRQEIATFAPAIASTLQGLLQRSLPTKPNIFVAMGDLSGEGRLSYSGDALPGQYQMTLAGGAWKKSSPKVLAVLRRTTAHEAAHLWQEAARPKSDAVPEWIHEGGADALAGEAMLASGYWTSDELKADLAAARSECASGLEGVSLQKAEAEGRWGAVYACGRILNVAAAGPEGIAAFWREFVQRSAIDGYDEAAFLALAEERAGAETADAMRDLVRINEARPDQTIDRLLK
ncbi:MAG: hypothetical protein AAB227_03845 [Pseudomonadota bacterium]